jgi:hypothetical protein
MEHNNDFEYNEDNNNFEDNYVYDNHFESDWERENFYAITNGQYGNYDDFKKNGGDLDYLMDCLGF